MKFKLAVIGVCALLAAGLSLSAGQAQNGAGSGPQTSSPSSAVHQVDGDMADAIAGLTGRDRPEDVIYARRLVMTMIGQRIYTLSLMGMPGAEFHADVAQDDLLDIGFLLNTFPHLFPPQTNSMPEQEEPGDLHATNVRPEVWEDFDSFYDRAIAAGDLAFAALQAEPGPEFVDAIAALQGACDSCHADYRRTRSTYGIPIPPLD